MVTAPRARGRIAGMTATILIHAALLVGWYLARPAPAQDNRAVKWIELINIPPPRTEPTPPSPAREVPPPKHAQQPARADRAPIVLVRPRDEAPAPAVVAEAPPGAAPAPVLSAKEMLRQAHLNIGAMEKELLKENPRRGLVEEPSTPITRLREGIQAAADAKPNAWYEAPKITEVIERGQAGKRVYRVVGALGTYCLVYHPPGSMKGAEQGTNPDKRQCDKLAKVARKK